MTKTIGSEEMKDYLLKRLDIPTRILELESEHFMLFRKRVQRKTGGCKNKWIMTVKVLTLPDYAEILNDALAIMESFGGEDFGLRSRVFRRYTDAEKAWVYLTLKH